LRAQLLAVLFGAPKFKTRSQDWLRHRDFLWVKMELRHPLANRGITFGATWEDFPYAAERYF
jgi:hypothetical protein